MLADDVIADRTLVEGYGREFVNYQGLIAGATRFVLAPDFTLAADGLVENHAELEKIAPYCRPPYPTTWFEFAHADRAHWMNAPLHHPGFQSSPARVGFLMVAHTPDLAQWRTAMFWSMRQPADHPLASPINTSLIVTDFRTDVPVEDDLSNLVRFDVAPFDELWRDDSIDMDVFKKLGELSRSDWAGEVRFVFAMLGLLNARNVAERVPSDLTRLNRARRKAGKPTLLDHETLKIRAFHRPTLVPTASGRARAAEIRSHFVRGHFKTRRSGVFWWGPHVRGHVGRVLDKSYEVHR